MWGQQPALPPWAKSDPPEPLELVASFFVEQDEISRGNPARNDLQTLARDIGITIQQLNVSLASAQASAAALRAVDRDLKPPAPRLDAALYRYHRQRQDVFQSEIDKLKTRIPQAAWKSLLAYVIEKTAQKDPRIVRSLADVKPIQPGAPGGPVR